jgi:two-component system LytT family response regulator
VDGLEILNIDDIIHIKAEGSYCRVFLKNCQEMTLARPLKELDELLQDNESFYRTHKSHLINLEHVKRVSRINKMIEMTDGSKVEIAGEKKEEVIEAIKRYNSLK